MLTVEHMHEEASNQDDSGILNVHKREREREREKKRGRRGWCGNRC